MSKSSLIKNEQRLEKVIVTVKVSGVRWQDKIKFNVPTNNNVAILMQPWLHQYDHVIIRDIQN